MKTKTLSCSERTLLTVMQARAKFQYDLHRPDIEEISHDEDKEAQDNEGHTR